MSGRHGTPGGRDAGPPPLPPPRPGWIELPPDRPPAPTYWPAALALGAVLLLWGLVSSLILTAVGLLLAAASVIGWLEELRHD